MSDERLRRELARADLYRFIAACYYEPGPEFAEEALFDSMLAAARTLDCTVSSSVQRLSHAWLAQPLDDLLVDYARLFLGPGEILAPPYGSFWLTGENTLMQDATMAILELYGQAGFEMDEGFREMPDHIAAELEFLYLANYRAGEARHRSDEQALRRHLAIRQSLLSEHLGRWIPRFAAAVAENAATGFYRELAALTLHVVESESRFCA